MSLVTPALIKSPVLHRIDYAVPPATPAATRAARYALDSTVLPLL